jgi:enoyl-CoA hydratase/carnithine racemase
MNNEDNRFNPTFMNAFLDILETVEKQTVARTLVVTSAHEKIFSNGLDLKWLLPAFEKQDMDTIRGFFSLFNQFLKRTLLYPMVTVASISGHAFAGGAIFSCAFDFRFMRTDRGYFCLNEVDLGIPFLPGMNALLKKAIPIYKLQEMEYTGVRLTADACKAHHIVVDACHMDNLMKNTLAFAKDIRKDRGVIREMKARMYKDIVHMMEVEDKAFIAADNFHTHWLTAIEKLGGNE